MIANAIGAHVIAVDIRNDRLEFAKRCGASVVINATTIDPAAEIKEISRVAELISHWTHSAVEQHAGTL
jgi:D-arabinose 1-dehydrogenase-like Zn-dependent alcohol dehydrogenase